MHVQIILSQSVTMCICVRLRLFFLLLLFVSLEKKIGIYIYESYHCTVHTVKLWMRMDPGRVNYMRAAADMMRSHAGIMLSSSTNKHHPPLSVPLCLLNYMLALAHLWFPTPLPFHTFFSSPWLIHAQIIIIYILYSRLFPPWKLQPLTCRSVCQMHA
jgi:hypothetical protein